MRLRQWDLTSWTSVVEYGYLKMLGVLARMATTRSWVATSEGRDFADQDKITKLHARFRVLRRFEVSDAR
jgi:hypothetical protein